MAPTIFLIFSEYFFLDDFIKNPQTRNARSFLPLNISAVGSVLPSCSTMPTLFSRPLLIN